MNIQQKVITRNNVFLFMDNYYIFPNCFDSDYPGDCLETIVFSKNEKYSLNGYTHGLISHSIKHYKEFEPLVVNEYLDKVIELIRSAPCIFLIDNKGKVISEGRKTIKKINHSIVLNTLDMVNDKYMNNEILSSEEAKIKMILYEMSDKYMNLTINYINDAVGIEKVKNLSGFIGDGKILKFVGILNGFMYDYYLNFSNSGIIVKRKDDSHIINTFFRVDKESNSIFRISHYFSSVQILNNDLSDYFHNIIDNHKINKW